MGHPDRIAELIRRWREFEEQSDAVRPLRTAEIVQRLETRGRAADKATLVNSTLTHQGFRRGG